MPGSTLNHPKRAWRWKRKTVAPTRVGRRREMARKRGKKRKRRKTTPYQRRSQRRRARLVNRFKSKVLITIKCSINWVLISEGRASRARANSGRVASFCLDHRHGPSQKSLHTPDGRRSTQMPFLLLRVLDRVGSSQNMFVFYIATSTKSTKFSRTTSMYHTNTHTYNPGLACLNTMLSSSFLLNVSVP